MKKMKATISLLLVLVMALSLLGTGASATTNDLTVSKTIEWDPSNPNTAKVVVTSDIPDENETQVLFVGTLCGAHGMSSATVINSLNAVAKNADVDYILLNADNDSEDYRAPYTGSLSRGGSFSGFSTSKNLDSGNHAALKGFINVLYAQLSGTGSIVNGGSGYTTTKGKYDYIVLEFDSSRLAGSSNVSTTNDSLKSKMDWLADDLSQSTGEKNLRYYYDNNKVIWITDGFNGDYARVDSTDYGTTAYVPTNVYYTNSDSKKNTLTQNQFHCLCSVVAPSYYDSHTNDTDYSQPLGDAYKLKLGERTVVDYVYGKEANSYKVYSSDSRQMYYNNATDISDFLFMVIPGISLRIEDTIQVSNDNTINVTNVKVEVSTSTSATIDSVETSSWTTLAELSVDANNASGDDGSKCVQDTSKIISVTVGNTDSTKNNIVTVSASDLKSSLKWARLTITATDTKGFTSCVYLDTDGKWKMNPNNGDAKVTASSSAGSATATGTASATVPALESYTVTSTVTNGSQAATTTSGKGKTETDASNANKQTTTTFKGDTATLTYTPNSGCTLDSIKIDGVEITLDTDGKYTSSDGKTTVEKAASGVVTVKIAGLAANHTVDVVYVEPVTVKYNLVEGSETPTSYEKPTDVSKNYGDSYTIENAPAAAGYKFTGWCTDSTLKTSVSGEKALNSTNFTITDGVINLYGKWESALSLEKTVVNPTSGTIHGGDEVTYQITVYNDSAADVSGVTITDELPANVSYVTDSATGASYSDSETKQTLTWNNVSVKAGQSTALTFKVTVNSELDEQTTIANTAIGTYDGKEIKAKDTGKETAEITADPKQIAVTYTYVGTKPDGAPAAATNNTNVDYNSAYTAADKPADVKGYTFVGWCTDEACTKSYENGTKLQKDTTLYGKWESLVNMEKTIIDPATDTIRGGGTITYQIAINNNSTSAISGVSVTDALPSGVTYVTDSVKVNGAAPASGQFVYGSGTLTWSDISVAAKSSTYLTFKVTVNSELDEQTTIANTAIGTYDGKEIEAKSKDGNVAKITADPKLIAVKYEYIGTTPNGVKAANTFNESVEYNSAYDAAEKPDNVTGYTFSGWYTNQACTTSYSNGTKLTSDETTLYGKWVAVKDFTVSKEVSYNDQAITDTVAPGSTVKYTVKVKNNNTVAAIENVVVTDTLPEGLTVSNISDNGVAASGKITWTVTVAAGATKELTFNATIPGDVTATKEYKNKVAVTDADGSEYKSEEADVSFTAKPAQIPVAVTKAWSDSWDNHEEDTVYVQMYADGVAQGDLIELTAEEPSWSGVVDPYDAEGDEITYTFKEVKVNDSAVSDNSYGKYTAVNSTTESGGTLISNNYQIDADDLEFTKTADKTAVPGETFTYTLTVTNTRDYETAKDIVIVDELPDGLTIVEDGLTADIGSASEGEGENEGVVTWTIDSLAKKTTATLNITVLVPADAESVEYENVAGITNVGGTDYTDTPVPSEKAITEVRTFTAKKVWSDAESSHDAVTLQLKQNGEDYGTSVEVSEDTDWSYTWTNLPLYDGERALYAYTVDEISVTGYNTSIDYGAEDVTATVTNTLKTYSIVYVPQGDDQPAAAAPTENAQTYGTEYDAKELPTADYYDFDGWYTDADCTTPYVDGTPITDDNTKDGALKLYGKWTRKTAEVTLTGGDVAPAAEEVTYPSISTVKQGETLPVPADPVYSGNDYVFTGWYTDPECTKPYTESVITGDLKLYAGWKIKVTYVFPGDMPEDIEVPEDEETYDVGTKYESVETYEPGERYESENTGKVYEFVGWYTDPSMEEGTEYEEKTKLTGNTTLYGKWLSVYNVSFSFGDLESDSALSKVKPEDTDIVEGEAFVPEELEVKGYTFGGWYLDPEFTTEYDPATMTIDNDTVLYGQWIADKQPEPEKPARPPHTGDSAMPGLWLSLLAIGGLGLTAVTRRKKEN